MEPPIESLVSYEMQYEVAVSRSSNFHKSEFLCFWNLSSGDLWENEVQIGAVLFSYIVSSFLPWQVCFQIFFFQPVFCFLHVP